MDTPARVLRSGRWPGMRGERVETWGPHGARVPVKGFEKSMLAMNRRPWICQCGYAAANAPLDAGELKCESCGQYRRWHIRRIFCNSNSDYLDKKWPIEIFAHFLDVQRRCPDVTLINCTKRPENWLLRMISVVHHIFKPDVDQVELYHWLMDWRTGVKVPTNIIQLTSVENQPMADKRITELLKIPAACRGLSLEPLLGPVDISHWCIEGGAGGIDWAIIGAESGPRRRECKIEWIESLVEQGLEAGVAVFVKQISVNGKVETDMSKFPKNLQIREWPKGF